MTTYNLYALRYATNNTRSRRDNFVVAPSDLHDGLMPMDFFIWLAVSETRTILIDTGSDRKTCEAREHDFLRCPAEGLGLLGIDAADVDTVISTHLHWDHSGNLKKFANARFHAQSEEIEYAAGPCMSHPFLRRPYEVETITEFVRMIYKGRGAFHKGSEEIAPGIILRHLGGHTPGLQAVEVMTKRGRVILASDALHFYENSESFNPFPIFVDARQYTEALTILPRFAESTDHVIPGHDRAVMEIYPAPLPELNGIVVCLDEMPKINKNQKVEG